MMDTTRIASVIDVERLRYTTVAVVGCGGSANLVMNLVRCGIGRVILVDPDTVSGVNMVRQDYFHADVGRPKVAALATFLYRINPLVEVETLQRDVTRIPEDEWADLFGEAALLISTTDSFRAQATVNRMALSLGIPALWPGIYGGGLGGEIAFWRPGLPCYRCLLGSRYEAHDRAEAEGRSLDPPSDGTTIFDDGYIDAIAGMLAIGLLTLGDHGKYADLVRQLDYRNFLTLKLHPAYLWNGRDIVREKLGIDASNDNYFAWNTIVRCDPEPSCCPDCRKYVRGLQADPDSTF